MEDYNIELVNLLQKMIRPFMIRRMKADELLDLPDKNENYIYVGLTPL